MHCGIVLFLGLVWWAWERFFEGNFSGLTVVDVGEQVEIVVKEVCRELVAVLHAAARMSTYTIESHSQGA